ncbi:unnamed protein product [Adineta ricciae]|uniref:EGF-like domain-containing protein n=1 Tax=Adineta ricciae TaxID=249248 RepID=A0A816D5V5_ADIRI|nr:unnamed protein product [Adineta ricciae]CAF1633921.1 unnamed protein product [Adineta ricciae]
MHRLIFFVLLSNIHLRSCSDTTDVIPPLPVVEHDFHYQDDTSLISTTNTIVEDLVNAVTDPIVTEATTKTVIDETLAKEFVTKYPLNVNLSSPSTSHLTFRTYFNDSILLVFEEREIVLFNKHDGTINNHFKYATIIPIDQPNTLVIYDDNTQELFVLNSTHQSQKSSISFKPKQIFTFSSNTNRWFAETSDQTALYITMNFGVTWDQLEDTSSSTILGWSNKTNSIIILQHFRYLKSIDVTTFKTQVVLNDALRTKLFSRYLITKRLNMNEPISISHRDNLADDGFRALPIRFQSQGNFYCAIEDVYTQDLLLLFTTDNKSGEANETIITTTTCNLVGYSKGNFFNLSNIACGLIINESSTNSIECSSTQIPLYQIRGLTRNVFLANVASEQSTLVSFDGGVNWNKTYYQCDQTINCSTNVSINLNSLVSSNEAPGILVGKATNGIDEYVAVSSDGGKEWRLSSKGHGYLTAISNPNVLIATVSNESQHSFQYSTDIGYNWHGKTFLNETDFQILSLLADSNNIFYVLISNNTNSFNILQFNLNNLILERCVRHQLKEWSLQGICINGTKSYYKRRIAGSHCLSNTTDVRTERCQCSLSDFQCLPGYQRSIDGFCLPKSHSIALQDCSCHGNNTLVTKSRGYVKSVDNQCRHGVENHLTDALVTRRDPNSRNFFIYGLNSQTKRISAEIHSNDFDQDEDDEDDGPRNPIWSTEPELEITALVADDANKFVYMAVQNDDLTTVYRTDQNLRQTNRWRNQLNFNSSQKLYEKANQRIEYLTLDGSAQNLYALVRDQITRQQKIFILNTRTHKRRTIGTFKVKQKKQFQLFSSNSNVSYMSYDVITQEILFIVNSTVYGLNTLDHRRLKPRVIYEHSSTIHNALFVYPIVYFTDDDQNNSEASVIDLHAIDILAKSYAKNVTKLRNFNSLKLFIDMTSNAVKSSAPTINRCASHPCSDICIPLENEGFRCLCNDDAQYQTCSCPIGEQFITGACQAVNDQCAPGRVLCQNRINCAESGLLCEQDHTQYTESFKNMARCTLENENDGFDCYYEDGNTSNRTCIPFEWLCDGNRDCPLGNDEEHCHKMTTTTESIAYASGRCLTEQKFTHVMCRNECLKINDLCGNVSNTLYCADTFHLHCQKTHEANEYACKCPNQDHCIAMTEQCDTFEHCDKVCQNAIYEASSKTKRIFEPVSMTWMILVTSILLVLFVAILIMTLRYRRQRRNVKQNPVSSRTPADDPPADTTSSSDTRQRLLNNAANGTS